MAGKDATIIMIVQLFMAGPLVLEICADYHDACPFIYIQVLVVAHHFACL